MKLALFTTLIMTSLSVFANSNKPILIKSALCLKNTDTVSHIITQARVWKQTDWAAPAPNFSWEGTIIKPGEKICHKLRIVNYDADQDRVDFYIDDNYHVRMLTELDDPSNSKIKISKQVIVTDAGLKILGEKTAKNTIEFDITDILAQQ